MYQKLRKIAAIIIILQKAIYFAIIAENMLKNLAYKAKYIFTLSLPFLVACDNESPVFKEVDPAVSNIHFINQLKESTDLNILNYLYYYNGAGVAAADYNNDGLIDLYLVSNQGEDKLYLNRGNLEFEDVSLNARIFNNNGWTTGISNIDINNDGLMDIYISKVSGYQGLSGNNLLYINQGNTNDGIPVFKEEAANYGLNFSGFSTQAVFLDYDIDGDLDMFLLNHSVYPNRNYGTGNKRKIKDATSGDILYRNDNGKFVDVSTEANIFQGSIGYGLGVGVGDVNNDGYPDIYVGNDFFENDYLYVNNGDGTFREIISNDVTKLGHTSHFSMGNDIADINNDGLADIISLDMLPEDLKTYKTSGLEYAYPIYQNYLKTGFSPQYMQNTLHVNRGDLNFSENAYAAGIAATEWSWGVLAADFDNDGFKDLFISNGIKGATNDMDFINFIANDKIQNRINKGMTAADLEFISHIPEKKVPNYFFKNTGKNSFENVTNSWWRSKDTFSNGFIYADLDNDGDLDLVINNVNEKATILENLSEKRPEKNNFLKIVLKGNKENVNGIGAKVEIYQKNKMQVQEHYLSRGYLSSLSPGLHFGVGSSSKIDSLKVIWPGGKQQLKFDVPLNSEIVLDYANANFIDIKKNGKSRNLLIKLDSVFNYKHRDYPSLDFNREPLVPFAYSNSGPAVSIADVNNDGLEDVFFSGGKKQAAVLFHQLPAGKFKIAENAGFENDLIHEDVAHEFLDVNNDGRPDLIIAAGGNEFQSGEMMRPRLYLNTGNGFVKDTTQFKNIYINASSIKAIDLNEDGWIDLSITSNTLPGKFGRNPVQYLFLNDGNGNFKDVTKTYSLDFQNLGNVQDVIWIDLDNNGFKDAIAVGHWIPVSIFLNDGKKLQLQKNNGLDKTNGWWNSLLAKDFDNDGDIDIIAGNWGLNSRLTASAKKPLRLFINDFDDNGNVEPIITYYYKGNETVLASRDELARQLPFINKKFLSYHEFSKAGLKDLLPLEKIRKSDKKEIYELASIYFENLGNGKYKSHKLPFEAQLSPVFGIESHDFNNDGFEDVLLVGNLHEISTQLGRLDASHGLLLLNDKSGGFVPDNNILPAINGAARDINKISINGIIHFIITLNGDTPVIIKFSN